jgi:hypothetical protein
VRTSESIAELSKAYAAAAAEMGQPGQDGKNPRLGNGYATLTAVQNATKPTLSKHGLAILQTVSTESRYVVQYEGEQNTAAGEIVTIRTRLIHESGEWIEDSVTVPVEIPVSNQGKAILSRGQAIGVAVTYQRRYAWSAMCGVASEADEDGAAPAGGDWAAPGVPSPAPAGAPAAGAPGL